MLFSKMLKDGLKHIVYKVNYGLFLKNRLLLESNPDFSDNTGAVYKELCKRGINKKIKIVWVCSKKVDRALPKNVSQIARNGNIFERIHRYYLELTSKYIIDCNRNIYKRNKKQLRIHLTHGSPIKDAYYQCIVPNKDADYILSQSSYFIKTIVRGDGIIKEEQVIPLGFPRNDDLLSDDKNANAFLNRYGSGKKVFWLPTYRKNKNMKGVDDPFYDTGLQYNYAVPCIETKKQIVELNNILAKNNIILIIKPHPAENIDAVRKIGLSNIVFINDIDIFAGNTNLYQLLALSDALITDYSSVYYDYLLTKKPIGLAIPDITTYSKHVKMYWSDYKKAIIGEYIESYDGLVAFMKHISRGEDIKKEERLTAMKQYNEYTDAKASERVVDFFLDKIGYK